MVSLGAAVLAGWLLAPGTLVESSFTGTYRAKDHDLRLLQCGRRIVGAITGFAEDEQVEDLAFRAFATQDRALGRILLPGSDRLVGGR